MQIPRTISHQVPLHYDINLTIWFLVTKPDFVVQVNELMFISHRKVSFYFVNQSNKQPEELILVTLIISDNKWS